MRIDIHIQAESLSDAMRQMRETLDGVMGLERRLDALLTSAVAQDERAAQEEVVEREIATAMSQTAQVPQEPAQAPAAAAAPAQEPVKPKRGRKAEEAIAAAEATPAPQEPAQAPAAAPADLTMEKVREVLGLLQTHHPEKSGAVVTLMRDIGKAKRLSEADASTYPALYAAALAWLTANSVAVP